MLYVLAKRSNGPTHNKFDIRAEGGLRKGGKIDDEFKF